VFSSTGGPGVGWALLFSFFCENTFPGAAQVFGEKQCRSWIPGDRVGQASTPPSFDTVPSFRPVMNGQRNSEHGRTMELIGARLQLRTASPDRY